MIGAQGLLHVPVDTRMRTVCGGTCTDKRLPVARRMGRHKQKQRQELQEQRNGDVGMSIADDEAEKTYPTRHWEGTHLKEQFYCDTDDLQEAYLRGRNAPPERYCRKPSMTPTS